MVPGSTVTDPVSGEEVTVYPLIGDPPSLGSPLQLIVAEVPDTDTVTGSGAAGAAGARNHPVTATWTATLPLLTLVIVSWPVGDTVESTPSSNPANVLSALR